MILGQIRNYFKSNAHSNLCREQYKLGWCEQKKKEFGAASDWVVWGNAKTNAKKARDSRSEMWSIDECICLVGGWGIADWFTLNEIRGAHDKVNRYLLSLIHPIVTANEWNFVGCLAYCVVLWATFSPVICSPTRDCWLNDRRSRAMSRSISQSVMKKHIDDRLATVESHVILAKKKFFRASSGWEEMIGK